MMGSMRFAKGHGTGNDFVILPDPDLTIDLTPERVRALCNRRRGIGADGLLRVVRCQAHPDGARHAGEATWFMDYWNADGSLAEMCGNGARVFARYLVDTGLASAGSLAFATRAGVKTVTVAQDGDVVVDMGAPQVGDEAKAVVAGRVFLGTSVSMGNPHLVCPVDLETLAELDLTRPPRVDPGVFPDGVNVEFAAVVAPGRVRMRVHERGVGETLSCGTGTCAVAAVMAQGEGHPTEAVTTVTVEVPGGVLTVQLGEGTIRLGGPAVIVAEGHLNARYFDLA